MEDGIVVLFMEFLVVGVDFVVVHLTGFAVYCGSCGGTEVREVELRQDFARWRGGWFGFAGGGRRCWR